MMPKAAVVSERDPHEDVRQVGPQERRHDDGGEDQQTAHRRRPGLGAVCRRPLLADVLSDLELPKPRDEPRAEDERQRERGQRRRRRSEGDVAKHVEERVLRVQRVEEVIEHQLSPSTPGLPEPTNRLFQPDGPRRLEQHDVAAAHPTRVLTASPASLRVPAPERAARIEPLGDGTVQEVSRQLADPHEEIDAAPGRVAADALVERGGLRPELEHVAEHGDATHGRVGLGQLVERALDRARVGVVGLVDHEQPVPGARRARPGAPLARATSVPSTADSSEHADRARRRDPGEQVVHVVPAVELRCRPRADPSRSSTTKLESALGGFDVPGAEVDVLAQSVADLAAMEATAPARAPAGRPRSRSRSRRRRARRRARPWRRRSPRRSRRTPGARPRRS